MSRSNDATNSFVTKQELIDFLKENLSVKLKIDKDPDYYGGGTIEAKVKLFLGDEIILSDSQYCYY